MFGAILLFGPRRSHSSVPARTMMRPSRAAAVKDGPTWGPPGGLVLDRRGHGGRLVCVGIGRMTTLVVDRGEIPDRGMTTARVVEALDEFEHRDPCLGLRLEPAPVEKLAFQRGEEALAHGIVVGVSDRAHRGAHNGLAAAIAELNRGVLRALVGVVDHALRSPH